MNLFALFELLIIKILCFRYTPPTLAITNLYWKSWILLLMLAAHNPTTIGDVGWKHYPTLRTLIEMCITK